MNSAAVSVIIPTHNRASVLARALRSVASQTLRPEEVIVVDDGSTDETQELIARDFPEATYIRQENQGVSAARNCGIARASGNWVAFLDSDDEWLAEKLEKQLEALEASPEYRLCHSEEIWIRGGRRVNPMKKHAKHGGWIFRKCLPLCAISPSSVLVRRDLLEEVGLFDTALPVCEDYDMWLRICSRHAVLFVEEPLIIKHGGHADQLSRRYWGMDRFRIRALEKIIESGHLTPEDRQAAVDVLIEKTEVYMNGARKRGKWSEVDEYRKRMETYGGTPRSEA